MKSVPAVTESKQCKWCKKPIDDREAEGFDGHCKDCYRKKHGAKVDERNLQTSATPTPGLTDGRPGDEVPGMYENEGVATLERLIAGQEEQLKSAEGERAENLKMAIIGLKRRLENLRK